MTSPSAQKAAGEVIALLYANKWVRFHTKTNTDEAQFASIIQQAITEAVDAAVAQERAKYLKLAHLWKWHQKERIAKGDLWIAEAAIYGVCASELESLVKEK